jgi:hypothetical protein
MPSDHLTMPAHSASLPPAFRSPRRISITLPFQAFCALQERSDDEGRSLSNLASYLLESALGRHGGD